MSQITEITRRDIYDLFHDGYYTSEWQRKLIKYPYYGRLDEIDFLSRLYDLEKLPSYDPRYNNAKRDIIQHTRNNDDFEDGWVFLDDRFELNSSDEKLLKFLCEVFHPFVRDESRKWRQVLFKINDLLQADGYELYVEKYISKREVYGYRVYREDLLEEIDLFAEAYDELEEVGQGGFGKVYKSHNKYLDLDFAVKVYDPVFCIEEEQIEGEKRFFREARMLFSLNSNYIARIYDAGKYNNRPYIKMEFINGYNLTKLHEEKGNLSFSRSRPIIVHILKGLEHAHNQNIIHRDLKPENIIYSIDERRVKIIDFGISAFVDTKNYTRLTRTGETIAGGSYADPLFRENPALRDVRSDVYSVGAVWYYLLCGRAPIGSDIREYLKQANVTLKDSEIDIVMKCLSVNIEDRYSSCSELKDLILA